MCARVWSGMFDRFTFIFRQIIKLRKLRTWLQIDRFQKLSSPGVLVWTRSGETSEMCLRSFEHWMRVLWEGYKLRELFKSRSDVIKFFFVLKLRVFKRFWIVFVEITLLIRAWFNLFSFDLHLYYPRHFTDGHSLWLPTYRYRAPAPIWWINPRYAGRLSFSSFRSFFYFFFFSANVFHTNTTR